MTSSVDIRFMNDDDIIVGFNVGMMPFTDKLSVTNSCEVRVTCE